MSKRKRAPSVILRAVNDNNTKRPTASNRRRVSQIVHDDRGNARVEWIEAGFAGEELERAPLSIESTPPRGVTPRLAVERSKPGGFEPYARVGKAHIPEPKKAPAKRDLRKLGEWIKLKRELDARKANGELDEE